MYLHQERIIHRIIQVHSTQHSDVLDDMIFNIRTSESSEYNNIMQFMMTNAVVVTAVRVSSQGHSEKIILQSFFLINIYALN